MYPFGLQKFTVIMIFFWHGMCAYRGPGGEMLVFWKILHTY